MINETNAEIFNECFAELDKVLKDLPNSAHNLPINDFEYQTTLRLIGQYQAVLHILGITHETLPDFLNTYANSYTTFFPETKLTITPNSSVATAFNVYNTIANVLAYAITRLAKDVKTVAYGKELEKQIPPEVKTFLQTWLDISQAPELSELWFIRLWFNESARYISLCPFYRIEFTNVLDSEQNALLETILTYRMKFSVLLDHETLVQMGFFLEKLFTTYSLLLDYFSIWLKERQI